MGGRGRACLACLDAVMSPPQLQHRVSFHLPKEGNCLLVLNFSVLSFNNIFITKKVRPRKNKVDYSGLYSPPFLSKGAAGKRKVSYDARVEPIKQFLRRPADLANEPNFLKLL